MNLPAFLEEDRKTIEAALERLLPPAGTPPPSIHQAMRYSVFAGGKRIRPILCLESARVFAGADDAVVPVACALEFIHTYSLVHDDLPALDNDDLRRGKPTCHKQFSEPLAILAGDGLLTLAFETLARAPLPAERRIGVIGAIAAAAGTVDGMVGGQVADLEAEGRPVEAASLEYIHRAKTAALIRASALAGAIAAGAAEEDVGRIGRFGGQIGWAFQIVDDILDVEQSTALLGKTAGKDQSQKKATYPALYGLEKSHELAEGLYRRAIQELAPYGERGAHLKALAEFLVLRQA